ncbi:MAG TPA: hypothetical protein VNV60_11150 [Holophagaceae bacterium]|nr:hypothetical protein [Holophagaceae bacterium]
MPFLPPFQTPTVIHLKGIPPSERDAMMRGLMDLNPSFAPPQVWDSGRLFETGSGGIKELDQLQPPARFSQPPRDMAWYFTFDVVEGAAYAWAFGDDRASGQKGRDLQELRRTLYIYRNGGARWELWDTLQTTPQAFISWLKPLEGGGYLLGGRFDDPEQHRADPLASATRNGHGRLVIHDTEEADLGAPTFVWGNPENATSADEAQSYNYNRPRWMHDPKLYGAFDALLGPFSHQIRVPGHIVLVGRHLGIFIVISARTGKVERVARLFNDLPDDAMTTPEAYEFGVLGVQPRPDGHLLIAARSADAVTQSRTWKPDLPPPEPVRLSFTEAFGKSAEDQGDLLEAKQDAADLARAGELREARLRRFPDLVWWDLDPDTGAFRRERAPDGVPEQFPSTGALRAFAFSFTPDGNLEIAPKAWK